MDLSTTKESLNRLTENNPIKEYKENIIALSTENTNLKIINEEMSKKIKILINTEDALQNEINTLKKKTQIQVFQPDDEVSELKLALEENEKENSLIKQDLYRYKNQKKIYKENINNLKEEIIFLKNEILKHDVTNEALRTKLQSLSDLHKITEERLKKQEAVMDELLYTKISLQNLEKKHLDQQENANSLREMLNSNSAIFELKKNH